MILKEYFGSKASMWDTRVLATDISQNALRAASNAVYDESSLKELPQGWKSKYFRPAGQPGVYTVEMIVFESLPVINCFFLDRLMP